MYSVNQHDRKLYMYLFRIKVFQNEFCHNNCLKHIIYRDMNRLLWAIVLLLSSTSMVWDDNHPHVLIKRQGIN